MLKYGNSQNFEMEVINNTKVVLVDFYANWCGPCKMIAPILEKIANENDSFDIVKVDVDQNEDISQNYQIRSIPTLIIFKNGIEVEKVIGFTSENDILNRIKKFVD